MSEFDLLAKKHENDERARACEIVASGENIYWQFRAWCNAYKNGEGKNDARVFAEFIKENSITLNWYQRKCIAEKHFGYVFTYNYDKGDWDIERRNDNGD
jgi:hypothetical protein